MKRLTLLLSICLLALLSAAYRYYAHWQRGQQNTAAVPYVPQSAALVYETLLHQKLLEKVQKTTAPTPSLYTPENLPLTISIHRLGEAQLGYILYGNAQDAAIQEWLAHLNKSYHRTTRKHAGHHITELSSQPSGSPQLHYVEHGQYLIVSPTTLLIEDVVRGLSSAAPDYFLPLKQGTVYANFGQLLRLFVQGDPLVVPLSTLAGPLDWKLTPHHLMLNGFVTPESSLQKLSGQAAGTLDLAHHLPQTTITLQHLTFSDAAQLWPDTSLPAEALKPQLQGEVAHCTLPIPQNDALGQLIFIKVNDAPTFLDALQQDAATWLTAPLFPDFRTQSLAQAEDYIVLANSPAALRTWQHQHQQGKTWAHAPQKQAWLASTLDKAHYTLFVDLPQAWPHISQALPALSTQAAAALKQLTQASLQLLHDPAAGHYVSILLRHQAEEEPATTPQTAQAPPVPTPTPPPATQPDPLPTPTAGRVIFQAKAPLVRQPWLVKSHIHDGRYVLLQDATHQLHYLSPDGQQLWTKALEGPIVTDVWEVDFYRNGKTQYLFATDTRLHMIDYYGRPVSKYPHPLPATRQPIHLQVVDYNRDKHYRFLLATAQGDVYLKDKHYRSLPGWRPCALAQPFASPPQHCRVQGKDYFVALQTDGTVQALNRKGQSYPGFPVALQATTHNPLLVRKGPTAADTTLLVLTDAGQHITLTLDGKVQRSAPLPHAEEGTRFVLCPDRVVGQQHVVLQPNAHKGELMDAAGHLLFELPHPSPHWQAQYYHFGAGHQFYALTDSDQHLTYLYDATGKLLHKAPWPNDAQGVRLIFRSAQGRLLVYACAGTQCLQYRLP